MRTSNISFLHFHYGCPNYCNVFYGVMKRLICLCLLIAGSDQGVDAAERAACPEGQRAGVSENIPRQSIDPCDGG